MNVLYFLHSLSNQGFDGNLFYLAVDLFLITFLSSCPLSMLRGCIVICKDVDYQINLLLMT